MIVCAKIIWIRLTVEKLSHLTLTDAEHHLDFHMASFEQQFADQTADTCHLSSAEKNAVSNAVCP